MNVTDLKNAQKKLRRGKVLRILETAAPMAIGDANDLYRLLQDTGEELTIYGVHELLRDLRDRGYLRYDQKRVRPTDELPRIQWIRLEPKGRDILEGTLEDAAVDLV